MLYHVVWKSPLVFPTSSPRHFCTPIKDFEQERTCPTSGNMTQVAVWRMVWRDVKTRDRKSSENANCFSLCQRFKWICFLMFAVKKKKSFPKAVSLELTQTFRNRTSNCSPRALWQREGRMKRLKSRHHGFKILTPVLFSLTCFEKNNQFCNFIIVCCLIF